MKTYLPVFFILVHLFSGCTGKKLPAEQAVISVSILPQKYLVERIAGVDFQVNVLIPPGASPDTYELTPSQVEKLGRSGLFFRIGHLGFETSWDQKYRSVFPGLDLFDLDQDQKLIMPVESHPHGTGSDPHTWMSLLVVKKALPGLCEQLARLKPERKENYEENCRAFTAEIDSVHRMIIDTLAPLEQRKFMIYHPALAYFARDYGLEQISMEYEGKEPSPADMKHMVDYAREHGIRLILIQKEFDMERARTLQREISAELIQIDPLAENWLKNLAEIAGILHEHLAE